MQSLINNWVRGMDTYTHNGSTWLIFTDSKRWVIELTEDKTLWYNYNFFKQIFSLTSLDVVQNQHLITKWVEDNVMNKVSDIHFRDARDKKQQFEDTLENGVKETKISPTHTEYGDWLDGDERLGEIIKNGVKHTFNTEYMPKSMVVDIIDNGVKCSIPRQYVGENIIDKIIDKGVIETHREICEYKHTVEHIIQTGVKETIECDWNIPKYVINEVISEGVKKTMEGNYTDPSTSLLHIKWETQIEDVIDNGNKVCGTYVGGHRQEEKTETVIEYGKQI